jgi:basic membrane protein A
LGNTSYKRFFLYAFAAATYVVSGFFGCGDGGETDGVFKVGVVLDIGGKDDKGKNAMVWRGCQRASDEFPIEIEYSEPTSLSESRKAIGELVSAGTDLIIVAAGPLSSEVAKYASDNPGVDFVVIDGVSGANNVLALAYPLESIGYVAGAGASAYFPEGRFGFIGGRDDAPTKRLYEGFSRAVFEYAGVETGGVFLGEGFEAPGDTESAVAAAEKMYDSGADVIFTAAGPSNPDIFAVALDKGKYAIGFESNQNWVEPGTVFLSASRRTDEVVYEAISSALNDRFEGGIRYFSIGDDVIEFPFDGENQALYDMGVIARIENVRSELAAEETVEKP